MSTALRRLSQQVTLLLLHIYHRGTIILINSFGRNNISRHKTTMIYFIKIDMTNLFYCLISVLQSGVVK